MLSGLGMIAVAVGAVLFWQRRTRRAWVEVGLGALAWTVGVALKVAWALPLNKRVIAALTAHLGRAGGPASWVYVGLLTGVFEVGVTWLIVRYTRLRRVDRAGATAFGVGFGAIEALLLGLGSLVGMTAAAFFWSKLPPEAQTALGAQTTTRWVIPVPIYERVYALLAHVVSCVLVVEAVQQGKARWFWVSFAYKSAIDASAAWALMAWDIRASFAHQLWFELVLSLCVFASLALLPLARRGAAAPAPAPGPVATG